jgi:hypothetical protein
MVRINTLFACSLFVAAIVAANMSVAFFGPMVTPINAFLLIGLDLSLRDALHDRWANDGIVWRMGALILAGSAISFLVNPATGMIAIASCVSFGASSAADALTYGMIRKRPFMIRANGSNLVGAGVDSILFPTIAFGVLMPHIVLMQFAAKVAGGFVWSLVLRKVARA